MGRDMHIGIVVGERSGDVLGAGLMAALGEVLPGVRFSGVGGEKMGGLGFESIAPMERLAVMGFVEPLARLPELLRIKKRVEQHFLNDPPDLYVGIDAPDFNLRVEERLKQSGISTAHYVSPSVWAYRAGRIHRIKRAVDLMLTLFPFETAIYHEHGIEAHCVGHPLADRISLEDGLEERRQEWREKFKLQPTAPVITLMPGSRSGEIKRLAPPFLEAALTALQREPALQFLIPCAGQSARMQIEALLTAAGVAGDMVGVEAVQATTTEQAAAAAPRFILADDSHAAIAAADMVLLASGTATLEAMLLRRPMVVCYKLAPITYAIASCMVKIPRVALPNLLAGKDLVPEYIQSAVQPQRLAHHILDSVSATANHQAMLTEFARLHRSLRKNASQEAARVIKQHLTLSHCTSFDTVVVRPPLFKQD